MCVYTVFIVTAAERLYICYKAHNFVIYNQNYSGYIEKYQ